MGFIVTFLVLSSGSMFLCACNNKRYEESLPLTLCLITLILYVFGWFNQLLSGVYTVLGVTFILFVYSLYRVFKKGNINQFLHNLFTPAFFIFLTLVFIAFFCNYGRLAYSWDEFSHWADVVKAMHAVNGFSTHPDAHSVFASYPPAMSLLQFMGVAIFELIPPPRRFFHNQAILNGLYISFI